MELVLEERKFPSGACNECHLGHQDVVLKDGLGCSKVKSKIREFVIGIHIDSSVLDGVSLIIQFYLLQGTYSRGTIRLD